MPKKPLPILYEIPTAEELEGGVYDGMQDLLGDDVLSSDWGSFPGDVWPGVNPIELPEAYRVPGALNADDDPATA